jgi:uncharacterized protein (DUF2461 family)
MKISIINIDSKIPNLALKKIEKYHKDRGDEVVWDMPILPADKTYVSIVFDWNKNKAEEYPNAEIGGSGYSLSKTLPPEIDRIKPRINLGFTTRGCIRKCHFCIVPEKEGKMRVEGDIYDIWDGKSKELIILDNNILALPEHFFKISAQIKKEGLRVDFNQGLDHRLLTQEIWNELISLRHIREIRFAFDDISYKPSVMRALKIMKAKKWQTRWYIYIGENDTFDTVFERMKILQEAKQFVYVMRDKKVYKEPKYIALASWGNTMGAFKMPFEDVMKKSKRLAPYIKYFTILEKGE